jgi:hypothetical protein
VLMIEAVQLAAVPGPEAAARAECDFAAARGDRVCRGHYQIKKRGRLKCFPVASGASGAAGGDLLW